jgi:hypothetical protein
MVWPSLAIISNLQADLLLTLSYSFMSILLVLVLLWIGLQLRAKYWVSAPVSIKVTHKKYMPKRSFLSSFGFTSAEAALIRKDFKSMIRRREIIFAIGLPVLMIVTLYIFTGMFEETPESILIGPVYFSIYLALTSIGQEGDGITNIYSLPIREREILKGKFAYVFLPSLAILIVSLVLTMIFIQPSVRWLTAFIIVGLGLIVEAGFWGIALGTKYADFTTIPRSRFIRPDGAMLGFFGFFAIAILTLLPILFYSGFLFFEFVPVPTIFQEAWTLPYWLLTTVAMSTIVSFIFYRLARSGISKLCKEHRY